MKWSDLTANITGAGLLKGMSWTGKIGKPVTLRYSFQHNKATTVVKPSILRHTEYSDGQILAIPQAMQELFALAFKNWESVAKITFIYDDKNPQIIIAGTYLSVASFTPPEITVLAANATNPHQIVGAVIFLDYKNLSLQHQLLDSANMYYQYYLNIFLHAIGHALGFKHPADRYIPDAPAPQPFIALAPEQDNNCYTMMSYTKTCNATYITPMAIDIAAAQLVYQVNHPFPGDDAIVTPPQPQNLIGYTLWDPDGENTLSAADYQGPGHYDLRTGPEHQSTIGNYRFTLAYQSKFSNVIVGAGPNSIYGNHLHNTFDLTHSTYPSVIYFSPDFGQDTIIGLKPEQDILDITQLSETTPIRVSIAGDWRNTQIRFPNQQTITLLGIDASQLNERNIKGQYILACADFTTLAIQLTNTRAVYLPLAILTGVFHQKLTRLLPSQPFLKTAISMHLRSIFPAEATIAHDVVASTAAELSAAAARSSTDWKSKLSHYSQATLRGISSGFFKGAIQLGFRYYFQPLTSLAIYTSTQTLYGAWQGGWKKAASTFSSAFWQTVPGSKQLGEELQLHREAWETYIQHTAEQWQKHLNNNPKIKLLAEAELIEHFEAWKQAGIKHYCEHRKIHPDQLEHISISYHAVYDHLNQNLETADVKKYL